MERVLLVPTRLISVYYKPPRQQPQVLIRIFVVPELHWQPTILRSVQEPGPLLRPTLAQVVHSVTQPCSIVPSPAQPVRRIFYAGQSPMEFVHRASMMYKSD